MESGSSYFIRAVAQAVTSGGRLVVLAGLPLSLVVVLLAVVAYLRPPFPASLRPLFRFLAYVQATGAVIVLFVDATGLLTARWEFEYVARSFPEVLLFVVPLGALTAPLWMLVLRRVSPPRPASVIPSA